MEFNPQFVITIPPHKEEMEARVFVERHLRSYEEQPNSPKVGVKLFRYNGYRVIMPGDSVRTVPYTKRELLSDVFVFEQSVTLDLYNCFRTNQNSTSSLF